MDGAFIKLQEDLSEIGFYDMDTPISQEKFDVVIHKHKALLTSNSSAQVCCALGEIFLTYIFWYVRGDQRKGYFEKAIYCFNLAFQNGAQYGLAIKTDKRGVYESIDMIKISTALARLYIDEKLVRDLEKGEQLCAYIWQNTTLYEPIFCSYAELFYKKGEYEDCLNTALATHQRGVVTQKKNDFPVAPAPLMIAGKALRALVKQEKKRGNIQKAAEYGRYSIKLGVASENDKKILLDLENS